MKNNTIVIQSMVANPLTAKRCQFFKRGLIIIKNNRISYTGVYNQKLIDQLKGDFEIWDYQNQLIIPGFFDMHFHWVQDRVRSKSKLALLPWLKKWVWPEEARFSDLSFSEKRAKIFFKQLERQGTVGGAIYSSIHPHALVHALKYARGEFIVGDVVMTQFSPPELLQKIKKVWPQLTRLAKKFRHRYALTPRFALSTDFATMCEQARLAKKYGCFIQTHLAENNDEIKAVLKIAHAQKGLEKVKTYTEIYHRAGLLGPRTIMGHAIHLSPSEWKLLKKTKTMLAHCPTSNAPHQDLGLGSGLFDHEIATRLKIPWALASDIGGGPYPCMLDVIHSFITQNRRAERPATYNEALYRATLAGAQMLRCDDRYGNLNVGKIPRLLVLDADGTSSNSLDDFFQKYFRVHSERSKLAKGIIRVL